MNPQLPFPRSYWVVPGRFLAGAYPGSATQAEADARVSALAACGVTLSVSLMFPNERDNQGNAFRDYQEPLSLAARVLGREVRCVRFPIIDGGLPHLETMRQILDTIDAELDGGGCVYVHCWGGRGRTGTTVGCWLVRHSRAFPLTAVRELHRLIGERLPLFLPTPENEDQRLFIEAWAGRADEAAVP